MMVDLYHELEICPRLSLVKYNSNSAEPTLY